MAKAKEFDLDRPAPAIEDEDEKTLAAIDEGIRDAKAGQTIPIEKVRKRLHTWITASSFTQRALRDLAEIVGHIAENDGQAASRFGGARLDHAHLLSRFPRMEGAIRKRSRVRNLQHSPVIVYYRIQEDKHTIEVLHLRHGSRR